MNTDTQDTGAKRLKTGEMLRIYDEQHGDWFKVARAVEEPLLAEIEKLRIQVKQADERGDDAMRRAHAAEKMLEGAREWINAAPHGDNCFVSDHYEGDPGNRCNCGKDAVLAAIDATLEAAHG